MIIIVAYYNGVLDPVVHKGNLVIDYGFQSDAVDSLMTLVEYYPDTIYFEMSFEELFPGMNTHLV